MAARYIARGDGFINPWSGLPTALWPPGYAFFLGALYRLFPDDFLVAGIANAGWGAVTASGVYALGRAAGGKVAGMASGLAFALLPGQVVFSSLTMSETLSTATLVLLTLAALRWSPARGGPAMAMALGAGVGLSACVRAGSGADSTSGPRMVLADWWRGLEADVVVGYACNVRGVGCPRALDGSKRARARRADLRELESRGNLWMGHHDGATGGMDPHVYPESFEHPPPQRREAAKAEVMLEDGLRFMLTHPVEEARFAVNKVRLLWRSDTVGLDWNEGYGRTPIFDDERREVVRGVVNGAYFAVLATGAAGLLVGFARGNAAALMTLLSVLWTAGHILFFGDPTFHVPVMFALCVGVGVMTRTGMQFVRGLAGRPPRLLFAGVS